MDPSWYVEYTIKTIMLNLFFIQLFNNISPYLRYRICNDIWKYNVNNTWSLNDWYCNCNNLLVVFPYHMHFPYNHLLWTILYIFYIINTNIFNIILKLKELCLYFYLYTSNASLYRDLYLYANISRILVITSDS